MSKKIKLEDFQGKWIAIPSSLEKKGKIFAHENLIYLIQKMKRQYDIKNFIFDYIPSPDDLIKSLEF